MKKLLFLTLFWVGFLAIAFAGPVNESDARRAAANFMTERAQSFSIPTHVSPEINEVVPLYKDGHLVFYAFNFTNGGFLILAADDLVHPVLGYSFTGSFSLNNQPCCFQEFMSDRSSEVVEVINAQIPTHDYVEIEWANLLAYEPVFPETTAQITEVLPLVTTPWNQDYPYNALCPPDPAGPGGHVYAGCVATTMAMIMYYWRYPLQGIGEKTHFSTYGPLYVNFGATTYEWNAMQNVITTTSGNSIIPAAKIQYHCGVAVNMQYGTGGSGAFSNQVPGAIKTHFGYNMTANHIQRVFYTYDNWKSVIKSQLNMGYPIYYAGVSTDGGHAWVIDGYQEQVTDTYFHNNWGWGGAFDGYYTLLNLNPGGDPPFSSQQAAIINFIPPTTGYPYFCTPETQILSSQRGSLEDGSGPVANYQNNANCSWLISPSDSVNTISVSFVRFNTQPNDILTLYDGADASAPVLGTFSGTTMPTSVTSTGDKIFITFVTDGSGNSNGWLLEFNPTLPVYCSGLINLTSPTGVLSDGSGYQNYNNNSLCRWRIQPAHARDLTLTFTYFDTEQGSDIIQVYDLATNALLAELSGSAIPPPITIPSGRAFIVWRSGHFTAAQGWDLEWTIGNVGIEQNEAFAGFTAYPNPAVSQLNISFSATELQDVSVTLSAANGQAVFNENIRNFAGQYNRAIDTSPFASGIYILTLTSNKATVHKKIVVE